MAEYEIWVNMIDVLIWNMGEYDIGENTGDKHAYTQTDTQTHQYHESAWPRAGLSENRMVSSFPSFWWWIVLGLVLVLSLGV